MASSLFGPGDLDGVSLKEMTFDGLDQVQRAVLVRIQRRVERNSAEPSTSDAALLAQAKAATAANMEMARFMQEHVAKGKKPEKV